MPTCWVVILAVVRLCTYPRLFPGALTADQALEVVQAWLDHPSVVLLQPGPRQWAILAALALEHGGVLHSCDADFRRFPGLRRLSPLG
ncbi:MAG: hypothetical protein VKO00_07650 [Cyanobacteriota bacterium]|nr:hypothetical protein [Cyanobacteriota bacterium]